jgi:hypothetical protein
MRSFATVCLVIVLLVSLALGEEGPRIGSGKKIIHFFQYWPTAKYLKENIQGLQSLPFDGFVIWATTVLDGKEERLAFRWWSPEEIGEEHVAEMMRDLKATDFGRFTENFLLVHSQSAPLPAPSWWDDEAWEKITTNMVLAARIAKECGLKGIFFEAEHYSAAETPYKYRFNYSYSQSEEKKLLERGLIEKLHTWEEYASAARRRGREIMSAMCGVYPNITVLSHPGWHENAKFRRDLFRQKHLSESDYGLLAPFADGLLEGAGEEAVICDGNTNCYPLTLNKRFVARREMIKNAYDVSAVPGLYKKKMKVACGIMMDFGFHQDQWYTAPQDFGRNHFTPIDLGNALYFGLLSSDRYVWLYSELDGAVFLENVYGHWQDPKEHAKPTVSDEYILAIRRAREPRGLDTGRDNSPVAEIPIPKSATELAGRSDKETFGPLGDRYTVVSDLPEEWLFFADDEDLGISTLGYHTMDTDVSGWNPIRIGDYFQRQGYRFRGNAWYRCSFRVPKELEGKKVFMLFGGVAACRPQVWVNAELFTKRCDVEVSDGVLIVDISKQAKYGEDNFVVVAIVTKDGEPAGIYKSVKLARTRE